MTKKPVRRVRADGAATREAILEAAADEFAEKGFELASVRAICTHAGVNVALANRYFGAKEALYRLTAQRLFGDLGAPLRALPVGTAHQDLRRLLHHAVPDFQLQSLVFLGIRVGQYMEPQDFFRELLLRPIRPSSPEKAQRQADQQGQFQFCRTFHCDPSFSKAPAGAVISSGILDGSYRFYTVFSRSCPDFFGFSPRRFPGENRENFLGKGEKSTKLRQFSNGFRKKSLLPARP